ncbi:MAG: adenylate/guanylate cyclase domain-containing protein [Prosthecobacter sp.]
MHWIITFRAKLILTLFPVVAMVTVMALLMAERKFSANYRRLFDEQFEEYVAELTSARNKRFEALSTILKNMAAQPKVVEAFQKKDFKELSHLLRPQLETLAEERLLAEFPGWRESESNRGPLGRLPASNDLSRGFKGRDGRFPPGQKPYVEFIDAKGNFMGAPQQRTAPGLGLALEAEDNGDVRQRGGKMPWLGDHKFEQVLTEQEVGYFLFELGNRNDGRPTEQVHEVFITPLRDSKDQNFVGAFALGLPLTSLTERVLYEQTKRSDHGEIMSGIWVEDQLVTNTIPHEKREEVTTLMQEVFKHGKGIHSELRLMIDGVRHQLLYRVLNPGSPFPLAAQVNLYSLAALDVEISELRWSVGGLAFVALGIGLGVLLLVSRTLSGPVSELAEATRQIEQGNFSVRVPVCRRDELGMLAASFNQMAAGLALQEKYRSVLNAVADRAVAQQLIEQSGTLGGELRQVSMLFCDIRGFTAITEGMRPADVIEMLNEHMTALTDIAYEHGGIVDKFVGDLIMVLFGAPRSTGSDGLRAVQCAQAMLQRRRELNQTSKHSLEVGIGIATGAVVAGCMGSDQRLSYTVIGHRVNLASRLCSIAQPSEILMDAETYAEARAIVKAEPMAPMQLKGISTPVHPWRVAPFS